MSARAVLRDEGGARLVKETAAQHEPRAREARQPQAEHREDGEVAALLVAARLAARALEETKAGGVSLEREREGGELRGEARARRVRLETVEGVQPVS